MDQLTIALKYAENGTPVFPCSTTTKQPMSRDGFKSASLDVDQITKWWTATPDAFIGSPNDDFIVLDFDIYNLDEVMLLLLQPALEALEADVLYEDQMMTTTMSGGQHYYFSTDHEVRRKIKNIAEIDVLGVGGYTILPDQKSYKSNIPQPWESFGKFPKFDEAAFDKISEDNKKNTKYIKTLLKDKKGSVTKTTTKTTPKFNSDTKLYSEVEADLRAKGSEGMTIGIVNYESETVEFRIERDLYKASTKEIIKQDPEIDLFKGGALKPEIGTFDNELLMAMFYNRKTQERLADYMGITVPPLKSTVSIHSLLPGHSDSNKSMGVRWNDSGTHLLVRDFSNHYSDIHNQVDYNLVRLYCVQRYNTNVPRLNGPEFTVWLMRLMVDAGLIEIDHLKTPIKSVDKLHETQKQVLTSFQLLDAIKRLYNGYDDTTTFADKFSSAWSATTPSTVNRVKKALVAKGLLVNVGMYDCSGGKREDDFFMTKLYKLPTEDSKTPDNDNGVIKVKLNEAVKVKLTESVTNVSNIRADNAENQVQDKYPDMGTLVTLVVDHESQDQITNFSEDFNIPTNPEYDNMFIPLFVSDKYEIVEVDQGSTYYMDQFILETAQGFDGQTMLIARGTSPPLEKLIDKLDGDMESLIDGEALNFVICSDIEDMDLDLDSLTMRFNEYVQGKLSFSEIDVRYMNQDDIAIVLDGYMPTRD